MHRSARAVYHLPEIALPAFEIDCRPYRDLPPLDASNLYMSLDQSLQPFRHHPHWMAAFGGSRMRPGDQNVP